MTDVARIVRDYILTTYLPGEDPSALTDDTPLMTTGILDSLATLELVSFIESHFGIELEASDVDPMRLGTIGDIVKLVQPKIAA